MKTQQSRRSESPKPGVHRPTALPGQPPSPRCVPLAPAAARRPDTNLDPCPQSPARKASEHPAANSYPPRPRPPPPSQGPGGDQRVEFLGGPGPCLGLLLHLSPGRLCVSWQPPPPSVHRSPGSSADAGRQVGGLAPHRCSWHSPLRPGPGRQVTAVYRVPYRGLQSSRLFTKQLTK